jgi:hypothetical protein
MCDQSNWYFLIGPTCNLMEIDECKTSLNGLICSVCNNNHFPDKETGSCVVISSTTNKECLHFSDATTCMTCSSTTYFDGTTCQVVKVPIQGCVEYSDDKTCKVCEEGYLLKRGEYTPPGSATPLVTNYCIKFSVSNCQNGGVLSCKTCRTGTMYFKNNYLNIFKSLGIVSKKKVKFSNLPSSLDGGFSVCPTIKVDNCLQFAQFNKCSLCEPGFYLNKNGKCSELPDPSIDNCFEYLSSGVCRLCLDGYYLNDNICEKHSVNNIAQCQSMSLTNANQCSKCNNGYFLASNQCNLRSTNSNSDRCKVLNEFKESCSECKTPFILTLDEVNCESPVADCAIHNVLTSTVNCKNCIKGLFKSLTTGECKPIKQDREGCLYYVEAVVPGSSTTEIVCDVCDNLYFLNSTKGCERFDRFVGDNLRCKRTSQLVKNKCDTCNDKEFLIDIVNYCEAVSSSDLKEQCLQYDSASKCLLCNKGYFFEKDSCFKITVSNCETTDPSSNQLCIKCVSDDSTRYYIDSTIAPNSCVLSYEHILSECAVVGQTFSNQETNHNTNVCLDCYSPSYPEMFATAQFCVATTTIEFNFNKKSSIPSLKGCQIWDTLTRKCLKCLFDLNKNTQLVLDNNQCIDSCPQGSVAYARFDSESFSCQKKESFCQLFQDNVEGNVACLVCRYGSLSFFNPDYTGFSLLAFMPTSLTNNFVSKSSSFESPFNRVFLSTACEPVLGLKTLSFNQNVETPYNFPPNIGQSSFGAGSNWLKYCKAVGKYSKANEETFACLGCQFGFTGYYVSDVDNQDNVFVNDCFQMADCDHRFYLMGLGGQLNNSFLDFFVTCHRCKNTKLIPTFSQKFRWDNKTVGLDTDQNVKTQTSCQLPGFRGYNPDKTNEHFPTLCGVQEIKNFTKPDKSPYAIFAPYPAPTEPFPTLLEKIPNPQCVACAPGSIPTYYPGSNSVVKSCQIEPNCDRYLGKTTFNKCVLCAEGYAVDENFEKCYQTTIKNCIKIGTQAPNLNQCLVCQNGYVVSRDQLHCNAISITNCLEFDPFTLVQTIPPSPYLGKGCLKCELGFVSLKFELPQSVCVTNEVFKDRNNLTVKNCMVFKSIDKCSVCSPGFVSPNNDETSCISSSTIPNCLHYSSPTTCTRCKDSFFILNNACIDGSLYNSNCQEFTSDPRKCSKCAKDYALLANGTESVRCFYAKLALPGCQEFDPVMSAAGVLNCTVCSETTFPKLIVPNSQTANLHWLSSGPFLQSVRPKHVPMPQLRRQQLPGGVPERSQKARRVYLSPKHAHRQVCATRHQEGQLLPVQRWLLRQEGSVQTQALWRPQLR